MTDLATRPPTEQKPSRRRPTRRGSVTAIPSWAALAGLAVVVVALLGFFVTGSPDRAEQAAAKQPAPSAAPSAAAPATSAPATKAADVPRAYVEVFNNTRTTGLAAQAARRVEKAGWKVVGTDNWNGDIPATTVYYPARLKAQARELARDVGVERVRPAVDPMRTDRLTVILTDRL